MSADDASILPDLVAGRLSTAVMSDILDDLGHRDHVLDPAEVGRDEGAVVTALGAVAVVPEPAHQLGERTRDPLAGPSGLGHRAGEPDPRQRGDDQVERGG